MSKQVLVALALALSTSVPALADEEGARLRALVDARAPSIVTVRAVLKTEVNFMGQSQNQESRIEVTGVVVDPSGLVMISSTPFSSDRISEMMGSSMGGAAGGMDLKMTPTDLKVVFEGDETEYGAFLAATDKDVDLAFVMIENLGERAAVPVSFADSAVPEVGDEVVAVSRLDKGFDYAPHFQRARISGAISKPRKAWLVDGAVSGLGLPIFTPDGRVAGVFTTLPSSIKEEGSGDAMGFGGLMRLMSGKGMPGVNAFVLPAKAVAGLVTVALAKAEKVAEERKKTKPAEGEGEGEDNGSGEDKGDGEDKGGDEEF